MLAVGAEAPDFTLEDHRRRTVRLSDFRGRMNVVIAFHPLAFTPVCTAQMQAYERQRDRLAALGAHVVAISFDPGPSKNAWAQAIGCSSIDMLSDFHPHGAVARQYGVMRADGLPERAIFVVDRAGRIAWAKRYEIPEEPRVEELMKALESVK